MKAKNILNMMMLATVIVFASCGGHSSNESKESSDDNVMESKKGEGDASFKDEEYNYATESPEAIEEEASAAVADQTTLAKNVNKKQLQPIFSTSAAVVDPNDTLHKFIRTADIRFKVNNVAMATYKIEDITRKFKGFVTYTSLNSDMNRVTRRVVSQDSILETSYFTVNNTITLRVPVKSLDTTLKEISKLFTYLDYRVVSANDVRFDILANKLKKKRLAKYQERMSKISDAGNQNYMDDKAYIEENLLQKQEENDNTYISDLRMYDQIEYSTVTLYLYQDQQMEHHLVPNEADIEDYRPSVGSRTWDSIKIGWYFIEDAFVGLIAAWPLWILLIALYIILRKNGYLKRKKSE